MEEGASFCRICLDGGTLLRPLKTACNCRGSMAFVHKDCLSTWRCQFPKSHEKHRECAVCKTPYKWKEQKRINYWIVPSFVGSLSTSIAYVVLMQSCYPYFDVRHMLIWYQRIHPACIQRAVVGSVSMVCKTFSLVVVFNPKERLYHNLCWTGGLAVPTLGLYAMLFFVDMTRLILPIFLGLYLLIEWVCLLIYVLEV